MFGTVCQHEACGEQDLSAVWSSPLAGVWVFGTGCQHEACGEQDLSAVWSSPLVGVWVFGAGANMNHVENKTCLLSGRLLWLESGCLVLGANMKHVENETCLLSGRLLWLESGCLALGPTFFFFFNFFIYPGSYNSTAGRFSLYTSKQLFRPAIYQHQC